MKVAVKDISTYLPHRRVSNKEIESQIKLNSKPVNISLEKIFGIKERRFGKSDEQVSDMACSAARPILKRNKDEIDLLIFAGASSDLIEPATANIIQAKLGLTSPTMDIKNACNSFTTAMQTAAAFIKSGMYENVLIVNGEKLSTVVKYQQNREEEFVSYLSGYTLGDGGCAMLLGPENTQVIEYQKFATWGEYWKLCTIRGGGSMAYWDKDKYYFQSESAQLKDACLTHGIDFVQHCFKESGYMPQDIDLVIPHQVSKNMPALMANHLDLALDKWVNTFEWYGNTAAASIPIALKYAMDNGQVEKGSKVLLLGFAAGINLSFQIIQF